jgi:SWIM zinc finger
MRDMSIQFDEHLEISDYVREKAKRLLQESHVDFVKRFGKKAPHYLLFWVLGDSDEVHNVVLRIWRSTGRHADGKCSCPAYGFCAHLLAAYLFARDHRLS